MRAIRRSYRIRIYPNGAQRRLRDRWFGAYRWLWNTALEIRTEAYRECGLKLMGYDISRWLTQWKGTAGHEWLKLVPATCLTQCLRDQDRAFCNFFAGRARYPKFKRKASAGSLRFQGAGTGWARGILSLPKLGVLKLAESLPNIDRPDLMTLSLDAAGRYFVSFSAEVDKAAPSYPIRAPVGFRQLAGRDDRDLCVDARDTCPEEILAQVLADEARSGQCNRACMQQANWH
jgi:putative transposase